MTPRLPPHVRRSHSGFRGVLTIDGRRLYGPTFPTIAQAESWVSKRVGLRVPNTPQTLADAFARLETELVGTGASETTRASYTRHGRTIMRVLGETKPLFLLRGQDIHDYASKRTAEGVSAQTVWRNEVGALKRALRLAVRRGWLERNPMDEVLIPRTRQRPFRAMTTERIAELVAMMRRSKHRDGDVAADLVLLFALTGLRRSEVGRLRCEDVQLELRRLWVQGKTGNCYLAIQDELRAPLERLLVRAGRSGSLVVNALSWQHRRTPPAWRVLEQMFRRWQRRLGEPRLHAHALRHSYGTALAQSGVPVHVIRDLMRHANLQMTSRYLHSHDDERASAASLVARRLTGRTPGESRPAPDSQDAQQAT